MRIVFKTTKLEKLANSEKLAVQRLGKQCARKLRIRFDELDAATSLDDMRYLPAARCHELKGKLKDFLAVDLHGGWRIVFEPVKQPPPLKHDGGLDWTAIDAIHVTEITNYHD